MTLQPPPPDYRVIDRAVASPHVKPVSVRVVWQPHPVRRRVVAQDESVLALQPRRRAFDRRRRGPRRAGRIRDLSMVRLVDGDRANWCLRKRCGARSRRCLRRLIHPPVIICIRNSDETREAWWQIRRSRSLAQLVSTKRPLIATIASSPSCSAASLMMRSSSTPMKSGRSACSPGSGSFRAFDTRNGLAERGSRLEPKPHNAA